MDACDGLNFGKKKANIRQNQTKDVKIKILEEKEESSSNYTSI